MATGRIGTTPVLQVRWSKAPSAGTTSLSGLDDNSVSLVYSVGYEAVYRNGVLLSRGNDYTATNGTTVTLIDATITGDIIEIFANQTVPLSDTFSQTVADGRFIKNTLTTTTGDIIYASGANTPARLGIGSTGQVLKVSGGVPSWGAGGLTLIQRSSFSAVSNTGTTFDNVFTSTYKVYQVVIESLFGSTGSADLYFQWRSGAVTDNTGYNGYLMSATTTWANTNWNNGAQATIALSLGSAANEGTSAVFWCSHVKTGGNEYSQLFGFSNDTAPAFNVFGGYAGLQDNDGFILTPSTGTFTGTVAIYGLATS